MCHKCTDSVHRRYIDVGCYCIYNRMTHRPQISDTLFEAAEEVREEYDYANTDAALRHMARNAGYDV